MVRTKSFVARLVTACACACALASPAPALAAPQGATALEAQDTTLYVSDDFSAYLTNGSSYAYTGRAVEPSVTVYYYVDEINQADDLVWDSILGFDFDYETYYVDPDAYWYTYDPVYDYIDTYENHYTYTLREGTDYRLSYSNNVNPGTATVTITGIGAFSGHSDTLSFTITGSAPASTMARRLNGATRYDTMAAIVEEASGLLSSNTAIIASGQNFPDALAASALAGTANAHVILTEQGYLSAQAQTEITKRGIKNAYIMGGEAAVSANVENTLRGQGITVSRVSGPTRVDTSLAALKKSYEIGNRSSYVIIATGYNFADSLSVSPLSYAFNAPIVLTQQNGTLTQAALDAIASNQYITNAIIVGGAAAVNGAVEGQLNGIGVTPQRIQGATRYETSKNIADFEVRNFNFDWERPIVATGTNFPDALAGAPLAGLNGSVMLLANNTNDATVTALASNKSVVRAGQFYYVLGGTAAVSNNLVTFIDNVLS